MFIKKFMLVFIFALQFVLAAPICEDDAGNPINSCYLNSNDFTVSLQKGSPYSSFFIDAIDHKYQVNGKDCTPRFFINSDDVNYREFQAIAQTGFATRSTMNVIFPNPTSSGMCNISDASICYIYCPIQSIMLYR